MLEALISLRIDHAADTATKKRGDVLVVALPDSPWSEKERKLCLLVDWDDATLETQLRTRRTKGEAFPRIATPYATADAQGETTARSAAKCDIQKLPTQTRLDALDGTKAVPRVPLATLTAAGAITKPAAK